MEQTAERKVIMPYKRSKPAYEWQDMKHISSFEIYSKLALVTESKICPWTREPFTQEQRVAHALRGIVTEVGELVDAYKKHLYYGKELDVVNIKEEIGDCFWYIALATDALQIPVEINSQHPLWNSLDNSTDVHGCDIVDGLIPLFAQLWDSSAKEHKELFEMHLLVLFMKLSQLNCCMGATLAETLSGNIEKLAFRYSSKFNKADALSRDLKTERNILEG